MVHVATAIILFYLEYHKTFWITFANQFNKSYELAIPTALDSLGAEDVSEANGDGDKGKLGIEKILKYVQTLNIRKDHLDHMQIDGDLNSEDLALIEEKDKKILYEVLPVDKRWKNEEKKDDDDVNGGADVQTKKNDDDENKITNMET